VRHFRTCHTDGLLAKHLDLRRTGPRQFIVSGLVCGNLVDGICIASPLADRTVATFLAAICMAASWLLTLICRSTPFETQIGGCLSALHGTGCSQDIGRTAKIG
jgi:hypothetical protein